ncbi:MAG: exosortase [Methylobacter sp.]|nr:MAG: exosortase [Methylobacter sp.]PPD18346.1 MAG: exosortase [Methylobacter sp.]PPD34349.1 MAG: exosortase [Methylomonas sp.]
MAKSKYLFAPTLLIVLLGNFNVAYAVPDSCGKLENKALNGFANMTTAAVEIPKNIINTSNDSNIIYGIVGGILKGTIHTVGRISVGLLDLITFPIPTKPIVQPNYVWQNFKIDTTYGDLFSLSDCSENKPAETDTHVMTPTVAPAPAKTGSVPSAPYQPDNVSNKLDQVFKKEMRK